MFLCCLKFCTQLWENDVLKPLSRDGNVVTDLLHLNQLDVAAIKLPIQEIVLELEHSLLCQLILSDSDLEWAIDCDARLPAFQLISLPELFQIAEVPASQRSVHHLLHFNIEKLHKYPPLVRPLDIVKIFPIVLFADLAIFVLQQIYSSKKTLFSVYKKSYSSRPRCSQ